MFHVSLICSDEGCAAEVEAWGELCALELLVCDGCGCLLQVVAVSEAARQPAPLARLPVRAKLARAA
jgi:hypothetical protein